MRAEGSVRDQQAAQSVGDTAEGEAERWLDREWFSAAELAEMKIGGFPTTKMGIREKAKREGWESRERIGRGGGREYHLSALPAWVKLIIVRREKAQKPRPQDADRAASKAALERSEQARWYERQTAEKKKAAAFRLEVLSFAEKLHLNGFPKHDAVTMTAAEYRRDGHKVSKSTIFEWFRLVAGRERCDWAAYLAPRHTGRTASIECHPDAWEMLKADYLRAERPNFSDCYERMTRAGAPRGWTFPSERTLLRRLHGTIAPQVIVLKREGAEALKRMYPAQERDRSIFHALEAVNADGHTWDDWVEWPDGEVRRPCMVAFQDLYSGKILSWRVDKTENGGCVRLAFGDLVEDWGIPANCWLDNGREFANKWLTGGTPTRYRFTVREEDPLGILTQLGIAVHWTQPYSGQSKPIERAFRDFAGNIAKHPAFAGAWTGNSPVNKPENYRSKAVPLERFLEVVASEIRAHNARAGRQSRVCGGTLSFDEAFEESYKSAPITQAADWQRRLWLLAADGVTVSGRDGAIKLMGNRYWADFLHLHRGETVVARFDPEFLHDGLHIYRLDGAYLGHALVTDPAGFDSADKAREHGRQRKRWLRAKADMADAEIRMSPAMVASLVPLFPIGPAPEAKVVQLAHPVHDLKRTPSRDLTPEQESRRDALVMEFPQTLAAEPTPEERQRAEKRARFARALRIETALDSIADGAAGEAGDGEVAWLRGYQQTPEYRAQKAMMEDFGVA